MELFAFVLANFTEFKWTDICLGSILRECKTFHGFRWSVETARAVELFSHEIMLCHFTLIELKYSAAMLLSSVGIGELVHPFQSFVERWTRIVSPSASSRRNSRCFWFIRKSEKSLRWQLSKRFASLIETAKLRFSPPIKAELVMPTTSPAILNKGPPLLP